MNFVVYGASFFHLNRPSGLNMKKNLLLLAFLFACLKHSQSQDQYELRKPDSLKMERLKKLLPSLKGTERIDSMQQLCLYLGYLVDPTGGFEYKQDSIRHYSTLAYEEAKSLNYKQGFALAMLNMLPDSGKESKIREAIRIGEEIKSEKVLGWAYYILADNTDRPLDPPQHVEYYKKALSHFLKAGDTLRAGELSTWLAMEYSGRAEYEEAFEYGTRSLELLKRKDLDFASWHEELVTLASESMADLYTAAGDYDAALNQLRTASYGPHSFAGLFLEMEQYDSALVYYNRWRNQPYLFINTNSLHRVFQYAIRARILIHNKEFDNAIPVLKACIDTVSKYMKPPRNFKPISVYWLLMAEAYSGKQDYNTALNYAKKAVQVANNTGFRTNIMESYQRLSSVYHYLGMNDSAYEYLLKGSSIKDSIQNKKLLLKLYNNLYKYKKEAEDTRKQAEIGFLNRDNQIKKQQLKQEAITKKFLVALFIAALLVGLYAYRNLALKRKNDKQLWMVQKLESEKKEAELKRQASDLQMQALRAQMNPHFIFNSLSSINWFIMENDKEKASDYLTRFSRLMRMVLNAQKPTIPLEDELTMLELYLDMERMRLNYSFDYSVTFTNAVDAGGISIPPMLLQPFCENAIWHGFANLDANASGSKTQGQLNINIKTEGNMIEFAVTDNGIGRKEAEILARRSVKKERSKGLSITRERLALFCAEHNAEAGFEIKDLADEKGAAAGTRVILRISYNQVLEEVA